MNIRFFTGLLLSSACLFPSPAGANSFYLRAPGFDIPKGPIAYMGTWFQPLKIYAAGSTSKTVIPKLTVFDNGTLFTPEKAMAVNDTNQALAKKAAELGLPLAAVPFQEPYQNALLMHVLNPSQYLYNPGITRFCGNRPFILIGIIDYYADSSFSIDIRPAENGNPVDYWGRRSILEKDGSVFAMKGKQKAIALEFFLVSTQDGKTLWQANTITTNNGPFGSYRDVAKGLIESALKDLMKQ
jgi:hypothetical protein